MPTPSSTPRMPGHFEAVLRAVIAFVVLPNLFFWLVKQFYFLDRPLINLDYAVLGVLWFWIPVWLRVTAFAVAFVADVIVSTGSMYNINPLAGVVALFRAPIGLIMTVVLVFAVSCMIAAGLGALVNRFMRKGSAPWVAAASIAAAVLGLILGLPLRSSGAK